MSDNARVDKEALYGEFISGARWRQNLIRKATHKALDIADDDGMPRIAVRNGVTWRELLALAVIVIASLGVIAWIMTQQTAAPPPAAIEDTEYDVRFYDADGNTIAIPRWAGAIDNE